jgi:hypothetical protein
MDPESPTARWSKAYLCHLVRSGEILGAMLMTEQNLWFYQQLMQNLRDSIDQGRFATYAEGFRARYCRQAVLPSVKKSGRIDWADSSEIGAGPPVDSMKGFAFLF